MAEPGLLRGWVLHRRMRPIRHRFTHRISALLLDIDHLAESAKRLHLFSHNRPNIFSLYDRDHGGRDGRPLRPWVDELLRCEGVDLGDGQVLLFCMPRMLGYVFNPLSIFFCYHEDGALGALIYEVKNTFGEQHCYVVPVHADERLSKALQHERKKTFYVSPFIGMAARYRFRIVIPGDSLKLLIRESDDSGEFMVAALSARQSKLTDTALMLTFLRDPIMTFKVTIAIHWQALRLWVKRAPAYRHVPTPSKAP